MENSEIDDGVRELEEKIAAVDPGFVRALDERGIRASETSTRFSLRPSPVIATGRPMDLPVIVGPSCAAEADGLIAGSHYGPQTALYDTEQVLAVEEFMGLRETLRTFARATGREVI